MRDEGVYSTPYTPMTRSINDPGDTGETMSRESCGLCPTRYMNGTDAIYGGPLIHPLDSGNRVRFPAGAMTKQATGRTTMFEQAMFLELMERVRDLCHQNSKEKGFWDEGERRVIVDGCMGPDEVVQKTKPWNFGEKVALIHSELSEMFEAWRKNVKETEKDISIIDGGNTRRMTAIEEEMADTFIRLFDLCGKLDIDIGRVILAKMEYNKSRPHMHGGRKC